MSDRPTRDEPCASDVERKRLANVFAAFALALTDKINMAMEAETKRSPTATATLIQIGFNPGLSIERLRQMIGLSHSASVRVVAQLESDGFVNRARNTDADSRVASLTLTNAGDDEVRKVLSARSRIAERLLENESPEELQGISHFIERAIPSVVNKGTDQDVVCRLCDMSVCPQDTCPINTCIHDHRISSRQ